MSRAGTIDGPRLASERGVVTGVLGISDLPRLAEAGCEAADVRYAIRGDRDADGRPMLRIEASGELRLTCQRCLGPLEFRLAVASDLELAHSQAEIDTAEDDRDRVLASPAMDVAALVEDEALLALPMIPAHEHCTNAAAAGSSVRESPFAALGELRNGGGGARGPHRKDN